MPPYCDSMLGYRCPGKCEQFCLGLRTRIVIEQVLQQKTTVQSCSIVKCPTTPLGNLPLLWVTSSEGEVQELQ